MTNRTTERGILDTAVKYFALLGVLAALPVSGAASARTTGSNDGALAVKNADGRVIFIGRGLAIGRIDNGQVTIKDPNPNDGSKPIVNGADTTASVGERTTRYAGSNMRFRIIGGAFAITVNGTGIDVSAIGRGMVTLDGAPSAKGTVNGTYSINGDDSQPFPAFRLTFPLGPALPGGP